MKWWRPVLRRAELDRRLDSELRFHFESQVAEKMRSGATEAEARRQVALAFGNVEAMKDDCRDARGTVWLESIGRDLWFALRTLRASPVFTLAAVLTLALGIGANTAMFGLLDAVRLRSLPVPRPQELVRIQVHNKSGWGLSQDEANLTSALWQQMRDHGRPFSGLLAWYSSEVRVGEVQTRHAYGMLVSSDLFRTLGLAPAAGRFFRGEDDQHGCAAPGVVISHSFWQSEYGGQQAAIGRRLFIEAHPYEVIGVAPESFTGLEVGRTFDVAIPMCALRAQEPDNDLWTRRDIFWLTVIGRLAPGWTAQQASDYLRSISAGVFQTTLPTGYATDALQKYRKFRLEAISAGSGVSPLRRRYSNSLWLLLGIASLVLLIACANLTNLMLARASARQREFAVRLALGAPRARLIQQSFCESLMVAFCGAAFGLLLARVLSAGVVAFVSTQNDPVNLSVTLDWRVAAFVAGVAVSCCLLFGLAPALRASHIEPADSIRSGGRGMTADRRRFSFQRTLVVVQIAVSLILVVGALLFVGSFRHLMTMDPGFREKGILLAQLDLTKLHLPDRNPEPFKRTLLDEIRSFPRVEAAATTSNFVIGGGMWHLGVRTGGTEGWAAFTWVSPGQFETLGTPLLAGRDFNKSDTAGSSPVAIVNQTFAGKYFGNANPIGRTFRTGAEPGYPETLYQIVGMVKDTRYFDLRNDIEPMAWVPSAQWSSAGPGLSMYIRSSAPLGPLMSDLQRRIGREHPGISAEFHIFRQRIEEGLVRERLMAALSGFFGVLAVSLAAIGLYGVTAYIAVRRQNEIGIRMALGATRGEVTRMVMKDAALLLVAGLAIGSAAALALSSFAASMLFGLQPRDPIPYILAAAVLAAGVALGSWIPARRVSRLDPVSALRVE